MERKTEYQIRVLPPDFNSCITIDSEPKRMCEANLVYKIPEKTFDGINVKLRIRKRAKDFINMWYGKLFAVIYIDDENQECLYFGKLFFIERDYPKEHTQQPILYLTRCVGSTISKKHWSKVEDYIFSHCEEIYNLEAGDVLKYVV